MQLHFSDCWLLWQTVAFWYLGNVRASKNARPRWHFMWCRKPRHFWWGAHSLKWNQGPQMPWSHYLWKDRAASPGHWKGRWLGENILAWDLPVTWTHLGPWGESHICPHLSCRKMRWLIPTNCEVTIIISDRYRLLCSEQELFHRWRGTAGWNGSGVTRTVGEEYV